MITMTTQLTTEQDKSFLPPRSLAVAPIIRRSRSLNELPGSIRVPILKRSDSDRMRARLEASMQGLEELKLLKEQQRKIIDDAMTSSLHRTGRSNSLQNAQRRMSASSLKSSSTSLAKICEEVNEGDNGGYVFVDNTRGGNTSSSWATQRRHSFAQSQHSRSRRPLSLADSDLLEQELFNEDERLKKHHSWTSLMHNFYSSQPQVMESTRSTECLRRTISDDIPVHNVTGRLGRSQSFSVANRNTSLDSPPSENIDNNENIKPKLRRASIQCDAVLSGAGVESKQRGLFKDVDLNSLRCNIPNPLRAVLMQYGNNQTQKRNNSDARESDSQSNAKVLHSENSDLKQVNIYDRYKQQESNKCSDNMTNSKLDRSRDEGCDSKKDKSNLESRNAYSHRNLPKSVTISSQTSLLQNSKPDSSRDKGVDSKRDKTNQECRNIHSHRSSPQSVTISSQTSIPNMDFPQEQALSGDRNNNNVSQSIQNTRRNTDAKHNNTCSDSISSDSVKKSETKRSLSSNSSAGITKRVGSRFETVINNKSVVSVDVVSSATAQTRDDNYNVCSNNVTQCSNVANKGQECLNANTACRTICKFIKLTESVQVQNPLLPTTNTPAVSKHNPEGDSNVDNKCFSNTALTSDAEHDGSMSNDNTSYNRKMLSIASDEGYVTSPPNSPRGRNRHKNSIISNGSWFSSDLDETSSSFEPSFVGICENSEAVSPSHGNKNIATMPGPTDCSTPKITKSAGSLNVKNKSDPQITDIHGTRTFRQTAV